MYMRFPEFERKFRTTEDGRLYLTIPYGALTVRIDNAFREQKTEFPAGLHYLSPGEAGDECSKYVFGRVMNEPWGLNTASEENLTLWQDTSKFLEGSGYSVVRDAVRFGDIVVYGMSLEPVSACHFGIIEEDFWVHSTMGSKGLFNHIIEAVPSEYGNYITFFRKAN